jgi:hypothetical protein
MEAVTEDLGDGVTLIEECLKLLEDPQELYKRCTDEQRRALNQALFVKLLIQEDTITGHHLNEPFAELHTLQRVQNLIAAGIKDPDKIRQHAQKIHAENTGENKRATPWGGPSTQIAEALPGTLNQSSKQGPDGGAEGTRTPDPLHAMQVRYQLRHSPIFSLLH